MQTKNKHLLLCFILSVLMCSHTVADSDHERQELSRLLSELHYLDNIIIVAKNSADDDRPETFDYATLEEDLQLIRRGIAAYLNQERRDPRIMKGVEEGASYGR